MGGDEELLQQLRRLRSPADMKAFLQAVLPQDEPGSGAVASEQAAPAAPQPCKEQPAPASQDTAPPAPRRSRRKQRSPCRAEPSDSAPPEPPEAEPGSKRRRYTTPSSSAS